MPSATDNSAPYSPADTIATLRWVRSGCQTARDLAAARVAANDPDPEWSIALVELTATLAQVDAELAACGLLMA